MPGLEQRLLLWSRIVVDERGSNRFGQVRSASEREPGHGSPLDQLFAFTTDSSRGSHAHFRLTNPSEFVFFHNYTKLKGRSSC